MSSPSLFQVGFEDQNFTHIYDPHLKINVQHFQHLESLGLEEWMQPVHVPTDAEIEQNIRDMNFTWESEAATRQGADCLSSEPLFPGLDTSPPNFYPDGQIPDLDAPFLGHGMTFTDSLMFLEQVSTFKSMITSLYSLLMLRDIG
jgi:hypothetical protein